MRQNYFSACCALLTTGWPDFFGAQRRTGMMLFLLTGKTPRSGRKHSLSLPQKMTCSTFHACRFLSCAEHRFHSACMRLLQNTKHCSAADCGAACLGCRPILFRLQAMPTRRCLKTLGRTPAENHMPTSVRRILSHADRGLQPVSMHADCGAGSSRCGRAALQLYRRRRVNCVQTSADRAAGCGAETGASGRFPVNRKGIVGPVLGTQTNRATLTLTAVCCMTCMHAVAPHVYIEAIGMLAKYYDLNDPARAEIILKLLAYAHEQQ
jgi:hypothetical protein